MISSMASSFAYYLGSRKVPEPQGTRFLTIVPYGGFPTADRDLMIAVASPKLWRNFCGALERPDLAAHPNYASNELRVQNRGTLEPLIEEIMRGKPSSHWIGVFQKSGIPCMPVRSLDEVCADPQAQARGMFPEIGESFVTGPPIKFSAAPASIPSPAPKLGEHTREALSSLLGLDPAALDRLAASGVIV